jgi:hypothetical protein
MGYSNKPAFFVDKTRNLSIPTALDPKTEFRIVHPYKRMFFSVSFAREELSESLKVIR